MPVVSVSMTISRMLGPISAPSRSIAASDKSNRTLVLAYPVFDHQLRSIKPIRRKSRYVEDSQQGRNHHTRPFLNGYRASATHPLSPQPCSARLCKSGAFRSRTRHRRRVLRYAFERLLKRLSHQRLNDKSGPAFAGPFTNVGKLNQSEGNSLCFGSPSVSAFLASPRSYSRSNDERVFG